MTRGLKGSIRREELSNYNGFSLGYFDSIEFFLLSLLPVLDHLHLRFGVKVYVT
jgi:hypothetical protein